MPNGVSFSYEPTVCYDQPQCRLSSVSGICARVNQRVESVEIERREKAFGDKSRDQDRGKGATNRTHRTKGATPACKVNWHREQDAELKNADSDLAG